MDAKQQTEETLARLRQAYADHGKRKTNEQIAYAYGDEWAVRLSEGCSEYATSIADGSFRPPPPMPDLDAPAEAWASWAENANEHDYVEMRILNLDDVG